MGAADYQCPPVPVRPQSGAVMDQAHMSIPITPTLLLIGCLKQKVVYWYHQTKSIEREGEGNSMQDVPGEIELLAMQKC